MANANQPKADCAVKTGHCKFFSAIEWDYTILLVWGCGYQPEACVRLDLGISAYLEMMQSHWLSVIRISGL